MNSSFMSNTEIWAAKRSLGVFGILGNTKPMNMDVWAEEVYERVQKAKAMMTEAEAAPPSKKRRT